MAYLKFLSDEEVKTMHEATLHIMSEVGFVWTHKPSLDILTEAGCSIKNGRLCFPSELVEVSISKANKNFVRKYFEIFETTCDS